MEYINKNTLKEEVEYRLKQYAENLKKADKKFEEDFMNAFSWGYSETKYTAIFCSEKLNILLDYINNDPAKLNEWVLLTIQSSTERLISQQRIVNGGSYWSRLTTLIENQNLTWWIDFMKAVEKHILYNQPIS